MREEKYLLLGSVVDPDPEGSIFYLAGLVLELLSESSPDPVGGGSFESVGQELSLDMSGT